MPHRRTCRATAAAILGVSLCLATLAHARQSAIPLYPGAAPGSEKWDWSERSVTTPTGLPMVQDVVRPVLLYYPADRGKAVGAAMIVAPGGRVPDADDELRRRRYRPAAQRHGHSTLSS